MLLAQIRGLRSQVTGSGPDGLWGSPRCPLLPALLVLIGILLVCLAASSDVSSPLWNVGLADSTDDDLTGADTGPGALSFVDAAGVPKTRPAEAASGTVASYSSYGLRAPPIR